MDLFSTWIQIPLPGVQDSALILPSVPRIPALLHLLEAASVFTRAVLLSWPSSSPSLPPVLSSPTFVSVRIQDSTFTVILIIFTFLYPRSTCNLTHNLVFFVFFLNLFIF